MVIRLINLLAELEKQGLTEETYEQCLQDIKLKVLGENDIDWSEIKEKYQLQLSADSIRKACTLKPFGSVFVSEYLKSKNFKETDQAKKSYRSESSINKDGTYTSDKLIEITADDLKNPEKLLEAHGFDITEWELVNARNNIWNVYSKQDGIQELYSSKITVKPIKDEISMKRIEEWFDTLDRTYKLPALKLSNSYLAGNKCLVINIADLHLNLQATLFSTGNEYNCDIAERLFFHTIEDILSRTEKYNFEKIIFTIGGDLLNGDSLSGSTTKGTPQDSDTLYYDACERMYAMLVKAVDILANKAKVNVIHVPGNHDEVTGWKAAKYLDAWFRNDDRVFIDYSPLPRKYVVYGKTLMVFAHDGNVKTLPRLIADEARDVWSQVETTEVFLQHLHTEQVLSEEYNMRIQRMPTISAKSDWTVSKGFGSKRQCKTFIFDKDDGLTDVLYTPIRKE